MPNSTLHNALLERVDLLLGGVVMGIDKFIVKTKYYQGSQEVTLGLGFFRLIDRQSKEERLEVVENQHKGILLPLVR